MRLIKMGILFAGLMLTVAGLSAQGLLTPEAAISTLLESNYSVSIARNDAEVAKIGATRGNAGMLPSLYFNALGTVQSSDINQRFSSGLTVKNNGVGGNNINAELGLNWTLFDGGRMFFTYDRLKQMSESAKLSLRREMENSVESLLNTYYTIVKIKQEVQANQFGLEVAEEQLRFSETRLAVGNASRQIVLQATIDRNTWKSTLLNLNMQLKNAELELNRLLARDLAQDFQVIDSIPVQYSASLPDLKQKSLEANVSVLISRSNVKLAEYQIKELKAGYLPQLDFIGTYGLTRSSSAAGFSLYNYSQGPKAGLQLSWNLFNGNYLRSQVRQSGIQLKSAALYQKDAESTVSSDVFIAYRTWQSASEIRALEEDNFNAAKQNVSLAIERQKVGSADILTVKEAQRSYEEAITRVTDARFLAKQAEVSLMRLSGNLIK